MLGIPIQRMYGRQQVNLDKLRLFVSAHSYISFINRRLVDETIKLEGKYCYFVCRDTRGVIRGLDC